MRNVKRAGKPRSLQDSASEWTDELLAERQKKKPDSKRISRLENRYKRDDVSTALGTMYNGCCCYCEAEIGIVAHEHIEHRRPKTRFPEYCFDWDNLHLGCPKCNLAKGRKWNQGKPVLDAVADVPIDKHLTYDLVDVLGAMRRAETQRGSTTIEHADLNRDRLRAARTRAALGVMGIIAKLNRAPSSPRASQLRLELEEKTSGPFGGLVKWLLDTYLRAA